MDLPWNKRQSERSERRRLLPARSEWLGRRRTRRKANAKRRVGYGALPDASGHVCLLARPSFTNLTQDPSLTPEPFFALILLGSEFPES